jgi:hypothetical protein
MTHQTKTRKMARSFLKLTELAGSNLSLGTSLLVALEEAPQLEIDWNCYKMDISNVFHLRQSHSTDIKSRNSDYNELIDWTNNQQQWMVTQDQDSK